MSSGHAHQGKASLSPSPPSAGVEAGSTLSLATACHALGHEALTTTVLPERKMSIGHALAWQGKDLPLTLPVQGSGQGAMAGAHRARVGLRHQLVDHIEAAKGSIKRARGSDGHALGVEASVSWNPPCAGVKAGSGRRGAPHPRWAPAPAGRPRRSGWGRSTASSRRADSRSPPHLPDARRLTTEP